MMNLKNSFPEKKEAELKKIAWGFYRNLCDIILEGIKGFTMSRSTLLKRFKVLNPEVMDSYFESEQEVISVGGHYANWEWGIMAASLQIKHKIIAFYNPLTNKYVDRYMRKTRQKLGTELISITNVNEPFSAESKIPSTYFFGSDQSPSNLKHVHWMTFLNQDTACLAGGEFFARRYKMPVVYYDVQRVKRGFYTVNLIRLEEDSFNTESGEITEKYMHTLESIIKIKPEDYLWSHRRWKHQRNI